MDEYAEKLTSEKIGSIFIYSHEAHPGEKIPHHTSFDQKLEHAKTFREKFNVKRPIYVDSLDGACHRSYGSMPNMTWIISRSRRVMYKANWTQIESVKSAIEHLLWMTEQRKKTGASFSPFVVNRLEYRQRDEESFFQGLKLCGEKAVEEFKVQLKKWKTRGKIP